VNILKKLAAASVFGAVALPFAGVAVFGGAQAASAGTPVVTCQAIAPASGTGGGEVFTTNSNGSDPGNTGIYFDASAGGAMELAAGAAEGATSLSLTDPSGSTALAASDQVLTIAGADGTYTVTADSFGALPPHTPDAVTITPPLAITGGGAKPLKAKDAVTVAPSTTTPYRTVDDATFSGATMTSASASFVNSAYPGGDIGAPIQGETGATHGAGGTAIGNDSGTLKIMSVSGTTATLSGTAGEETSAGPPATYSSSVSGTATVTIGETLEAPGAIFPVNSLAASKCGMSAIDAGEFAPLTATMSGLAQASIPNTALALEAAAPATTFNITYPSIGAGWADEGGYPQSASQPTTSLAFPGGKDNVFVLSTVGGDGACGAGTANCDSYVKGAATGDWPTTKGSLGLEAYGLIYCTLAESQAIAGTPDSGGPDNTANGGWITTGESPLLACDGGSSNPVDHSEATALGVVVTLELNPNANAYGTDNTPPTSIWNLVASNASNTVF